MTIAQPKDAQTLLDLACQYSCHHPQYFSDFRVTAVSQHDDLLIFNGPLFTAPDGAPTPQTLAMFNILKFLTVELSPHYCLKQ
ncbi:DUF2498 family protein [Tatumella saanichensis]|uniref:DUF2498 family protein n=1 Tax=Tatumella saanichensis TaxID=480813 RepID=UPI0004A49317|nr:DUF2498 family protein [Tatumella saanichensis]